MWLHDERCHAACTEILRVDHTICTSVGEFCNTFAGARTGHDEQLGVDRTSGERDEKIFSVALKSSDKGVRAQLLRNATLNQESHRRRLPGAGRLSPARGFRRR